MPTEEKTKDVERLRKLIEESAAIVAADFSGMKVGQMNDLRRALRERGVEFHVVKNRLTYLAADAAGRPTVKDIVQGPTGIALGFDDPLEPARALTSFIRDSQSPMRIRGGLLGDRTLSAAEVGDLAALPTKDVLLAQLMGQLQSPMSALVYVLTAPVSGLARVLQRRIESMGGEEEQAEPEPEESGESADPQQPDESEEPAPNSQKEPSGGGAGT